MAIAIYILPIPIDENEFTFVLLSFCCTAIAALLFHPIMHPVTYEIACWLLNNLTIKLKIKMSAYSNGHGLVSSNQRFSKSKAQQWKRLIFMQIILAFLFSPKMRWKVIVANKTKHCLANWISPRIYIQFHTRTCPNMFCFCCVSLLQETFW